MAEPDDLFADLGDLFAEFRGRLPARLAAVEDAFAAAMESGDYADARRLAHQLKGTAGTYGFDAVTEQMRSLEAVAERLVSEARSPSAEEHAEIARALAAARAQSA